MSKLLINERQLQVLPTLALRLGLNEAIIVQQLHFAVSTFESRVVEVDGHKWLRADLDWWEQEFPWWSRSTIERAFKALKAAGVVHTSRGRESNVYRIDHEALRQIEVSGSSDRRSDARQIDASPSIGEGTAETQQREQPGAAEPPALFDPPTPVAPSPSPDQRDFEQKVQRIWEHYLRLFGDRMRIKELTPPRHRDISKGLKAVGEDEQTCIRAVSGLKKWVDAAPDLKRPFDLGMVFSTGPKDRKNLTDKVVGWADDAEENEGSATSGINPEVPHVLRDRITRRRLAVVTMLQQPANEGLQERGREALQWLRDNAGEEPVITDGRVADWVKI